MGLANTSGRPRKRVVILGTRGIPARYGGFETFAEHLALYLIERGWEVEVYCPSDKGDLPTEWRDVRLRTIKVKRTGALGSVWFDFKSTLIAARRERLVLNLGYGTAIFGVLFRLFGSVNLINMDGLEWKREKWSYPVRRWLQANEWIAGKLGHHLIADHPGIADHLSRHSRPSKITMIPYGADRIDSADEALVHQHGLAPGNYALIIGRAEPENSILQMVRAFSSAVRGRTLAVLGHYDAARSDYQKQVLDAAGPEVRFLGALYDKQVVQALRLHAAVYLHGHQVGGTNPSLVEALGAGNAIVAHDNQFNRWVAGPAARYFGSEEELRRELDRLLSAPRAELRRLGAASRSRHAEAFMWNDVLLQYEKLLAHWLQEPVDHVQAPIAARERLPEPSFPNE
jgi:glycosyltransferase involved in cell wall biosynthesis